LFVLWPAGALTVTSVTDAGLVVEARGVTKWFGETTALDGVDFTVSPGVVHGLLGPNGAGKTTLLSALFGLVLPDEGTLRLFGRTRAEAGSGWLGGVGGFVETPRFYPYLSGRQNLAVLAGLDGGDAADLIDAALERVGLAGARSQKVRGYSLGMRQRLGLAAAMLRRPRLLILDEPTNGMDPAGIRDLRAALRRLAHDGVTVVLSSHDMAQVEEICDWVTVLHQGRVVFAGRLDVMQADAPDPVWRMRTSDDGTALERARRVTGVKAAGHDDGGLVVHAAQDRLDDYVLHLGRESIAIRGLELDVTPLESLFFQLTGDPKQVGSPSGQEVP
jgi:ABC-2 type transport system ATP-binding protein